MVYERKSGNDVVVVAVNKGPEKTINVSKMSLADGSYNSMAGNDSIHVSDGNGTFNLSQNEIVILHGATTPESGVRTVVYIHRYTKPGDFIFIRGGHDANLVPGSYANRYESIAKYNNMLNPDSLKRKQSDSRLDWGPHDPANGSDGYVPRRFPEKFQAVRHIYVANRGWRFCKVPRRDQRAVPNHRR